VSKIGRPEIGTRSKVGTWKSEIKTFFGNRKEKTELGNRNSDTPLGTIANLQVGLVFSLLMVRDKKPIDHQNFLQLDQKGFKNALLI